MIVWDGILRSERKHNKDGRGHRRALLFLYFSSLSLSPSLFPPVNYGFNSSSDKYRFYVLSVKFCDRVERR